MKDFFISYSSFDEAWAEWIAWELEADGYETMMQKWDFTPGKNYALEMNDAVNYAHRLVLILSESFLISDFTKAEWSAFFTLDPNSKNGTIIPIRVEECKPTGLLRQLVYIDFVGESEYQCRKRLLEGVKIGRRKPQEKPSFPWRKYFTVDNESQISVSQLSPHFPNSEEFDIYRGKDRDRLIDSITKYEQDGTKTPVIDSRTVGRSFVREVLNDYIRNQMGNPFLKKSKRIMSLILIDVDGMSGVNKRFGVDVGDEIMKSIGIMTLDVPGRVFSGRIGDDTLFTVLADTDISQGSSIAEKLLENIRNSSWNEVASDLYVTCSAGVAEFNRREDANSTVTRATHGLRVARDSGGNRVIRGPKFVAKGKIRAWEDLLS